MTVLVDERESYQHTFSNLKPQTPYLIRIYASNVFGNGENVDLEVATNPQGELKTLYSNLDISFISLSLIERYHIENS